MKYFCSKCNQPCALWGSNLASGYGSTPQRSLCCHAAVYFYAAKELAAGA